MKTPKNDKSHLSFRINIIFFFIFLLFATLVLRLGIVQIVNGQEYQSEIERTENITVKYQVPRGKIYDRNHRVVVDNVPANAITFTKKPNSNTREQLDLAQNLARFLEMDVDGVTERDMKDYWILTRPEKAKQKITDLELKQLTDEELYKLQLARITQEDLQELSKDELQILAIKRRFDSGHPLIPRYVKNRGVSDIEFATVSEHLPELPGVDTTTDWKRCFPYQDTFKTIIGNISDQNEGIPKEELDAFLVKGYNRTDRVGLSYIEKQYEDILRGRKLTMTNTTNSSGDVIDTSVKRDGKRGKDLILTIDMELQRKIEKILEEELTAFKMKKQVENRLLDSAYAVMMNPRTGEILAMAGKRYLGSGEFQDISLGVVNNAYEVGSSVKGATVLTGYKADVINPNTYLMDEPIKIKDTPIKKSWRTMGMINDLTALKFSSNVYMFRIAMMMGDYNYRYGESAPFLHPEAFEEMRKSFGLFGLGVKTGVDLPNESTGYQGSGRRIGNLMDLAIGQYDTYTPLQLVQYVSTIANGGYRMKPYLVKEIREPADDANNLGPLVISNEPKVLNTIGVDSALIKRVKEGFRRVFQTRGGTGYKFFQGASYNPAGKTGTAETTYYGPNKKYYGKDTTNLSLVGFAPFKDPEIAFSVVVPYSSSEGHINGTIGRRLLDAYFDIEKGK